MSSTTTINLPELDEHEAISDSPRFRLQLKNHEHYFQRLEAKLNEILKNLMHMNEYGRNYTSSLYKLSVSVNQLCQESFSDNALAQSTFGTLSEAYGRTVDLTRSFYENSISVVYEKLQKFIKKELADITMMRNSFDSMAIMTDEALTKNAAVSKSKPIEAADIRNHLMTVGACHAHTALDFMEKINLAHAQKDHIIIDALWTFVKETSSYFSRGHAFFDEWTALDNGGIADAVEGLARKRDYTIRQMQDIHGLVPTEMYQHPPGISPDADVVMEGYLYKRSSNAFKTWNRRWFQIKDNKLLYMHRSGDNAEPTTMEENLMLCLVRPAPSSIDRLGCFELVTPTRSHLLQADSESLCNVWMRALQRTILHLHESDHRPPTTSTTCSFAPTASKDKEPHVSTAKGPEVHENPKLNEKHAELVYEKVRSAPGNHRCADCGQADPKWASINLGVVICIECCGIHRSLGVQISKVRSLTMDSIDDVVANVLVALGNDKVNQILLEGLPSKNVVPPPANESSPRAVREAWIIAKYVERRFAVHGMPHKNLQKRNSSGVNRSASTVDVVALEKAYGNSTSDTHSDVDENAVHWRGEGTVNDQCVTGSKLINGAKSGDLPALLVSLFAGADVNSFVDGTTPLHIAIKMGNATVVEFLLLNGAKITLADAQGDTALHIAAREERTLEACLLMKRGADKDLMNSRGETPMQIAIDGKHADIVTLFRIHKMRDELSEEFDNPMNKTVEEIINDITKGATKAATLR